MPVWHAYFFSKLLLHAMGRLRVDPVLDALLLALVIAPLPERRLGLSRARTGLAAAAAAALAWRESWLPPPGAVWHFLTDPSVSPTPAYVAQFLARAVDLRVLAALAAVCAVAVLAARRGLRLTVFVAAGLAAVAVSDPAALGFSPASRRASELFSAEAGRSLRLGPAADPGFDLVIVHVCSLSWDDLRAAGVGTEPFAGGFHAVLTGFNTATSYSNPASLRLLRAPCGQARHASLFSPAAPDCYLLDQLRGLGYRTWAASDHDGTYDRYAEVLTAHAHADPPMGLEGVPVAKLNFNGTAIYDDEAVLSKWWTERQRTGAPRAALYFNAVSLHQGAHRPNQPGNWFADRVAHFRDAAGELFAALERFETLLAGSGRRVVVLLVAEHGAALMGSSVQAPDLRDIPLPALTAAPVAVRFLGPGAPPLPARPELIGGRTSYLALAELLRRLLASPPFGPGAAPAAAFANLPETPWAAENEHALVLDLDNRWMLRQKGGRWKPLPADAAPR